MQRHVNLPGSAATFIALLNRGDFNRERRSDNSALETGILFYGFVRRKLCLEAQDHRREQFGNVYFGRVIHLS